MSRFKNVIGRDLQQYLLQIKEIIKGSTNAETSAARVDRKNRSFDTLKENMDNNLFEIDDQIEKVSEELAQKANQDEVNTLSAQQENLIANAGNTDGNAELLDIRVGWDGVTYPTAGDAVRSIQKFMTTENDYWEVD